MTVRIGTAQPARRLIDFHLRDPAQVLAEVERTLDVLVDQAGEKGGRPSPARRHAEALALGRRQRKLA